VFVPQWKCHVWVHELTGEELDLYRQPMYQVKETKLTLSLTENTLRLLAYALRTEQGDRLWPNTNAASPSSANCPRAARNCWPRPRGGCLGCLTTMRKRRREKSPAPTRPTIRFPTSRSSQDRTVAELLRRISATELAEWAEFEELEGPIGDRRADYNAGWIALHAVAPYRKDPRSQPGSRTI